MSTAVVGPFFSLEQDTPGRLWRVCSVPGCGGVITGRCDPATQIMLPWDCCHGCGQLYEFSDIAADTTWSDMVRTGIDNERMEAGQ